MTDATALTTDPLARRLQSSIGGRYTLVRELGEGGMSVVYLAHDAKLDREVALKVLRPELGSLMAEERFLREIRITASLQHPNMLPLLESGEADTLFYFTMPVAQGPTLGERLAREGPLPLKDVISIAADVAEALDYAHGHDVVHRDIKPDNILLTGGRAIVTDFGVARAVVAAGGSKVSSAGLAIGTPLYMSPEQAAGSTQVDGRADIYALGCVVYEMLAGQTPFLGANPQAVLAQQIHERPPSLAVIRPGLQPGIVAAVERALAKTPADRFDSAGAFVAALREAAAAAPVIPGPDGRVPPAWHRAAAVVAIAAAAAVAGRRPPPILDQSRVVVFPPDVGGAGSDSTLGSDVATYVGHALEGAQPLRWVNGSELVAGSTQPLDNSRRRSLARTAGAAWFIEGSVTRLQDSVSVVLLLRSSARDTVQARAVRYAALPTSEARLAAQAVGELLAPLLGLRPSTDPGLLAQRRPAAIGEFLAGERAYARAEFSTALNHYRRALAEDSLFPLAAVKGAQAASWLDDYEVQQEMLAVALRYRTRLPIRYATYASGLAHYLAGHSDSALTSLRRALAMAPDWAEAWTSLGEVYRHLPTAALQPDSQAQAAFAAAWQYDRDFSVPLYHLSEASLLGGNVRRGEQLLGRLRGVSRDSIVRNLELIDQCVAGRMRESDWRAAALATPTRALEAMRALAVVPAHRQCAETGLRVLVNSDSAGPNVRFAAMVILAGVLLRGDRFDELRTFLNGPAASSLGGPYYLLEMAPAYPRFRDDAAPLAASMGTDYRARGLPSLWMLVRFEAYLGSDERARAIAAELTRRSRTDTADAVRQMGQLAAAHAALASGDTSAALRGLAALRVDIPRNQVTWASWEALGFEHLMQARLLLARGDATGAIRAAARLDAPQPVSYLPLVRPSLEVRIAAARALNDVALLRTSEARLAQLAR